MNIHALAYLPWSTLALAAKGTDTDVEVDGIKASKPCRFEQLLCWNEIGYEVH